MKFISRSRLAPALIRTASITGLLVGLAALPAQATDLIDNGNHSGEDHIGHDDRFSTVAGITLDSADFTDAQLNGSDMAGGSFIGATLVRLTAICDEPSPQPEALVCTNFSGANFTSADLSDADFSGADLSQAIVIDANMTRIGLDGASLIGLTATCAQPFDPSGCTTLTRASMLGADLSGADLTLAILDSANLTGATLGSDADGPATFENADLRFVVLDAISLGCPSLEDCTSFVGADMRFGSLVGGSYERADFTGSALRATQLRDANLTGSDFSSADFGAGLSEAADLSRARLDSGVFDGANLAAADLRGAKARAVLLDDDDAPIPASFASAVLTGTLLDGADFTGADLRFATFANASLVDAVFDGFQSACTPGFPTGCISFAGADLTGVRMRGANLTGLDFSNQSSFTGADLTGAVVRGTDFSNANLTGTTLQQLELDPTLTGLECGATYECPIFSGSTLVQAKMVGVDFPTIAFDFQSIGSGGLRGADTSTADFFVSGKPTADLTGLDLEDWVSQSADLQAANFTAASMRGADLSLATLCEAVFVNADLRGAVLDGVDFTDDANGDACAGQVDFSGAVLIGGPSVDGVRFRGVDFRSAGSLATIGITDLTRIDLSNADLTGLDFAGVLTFTDAVLVGSKWSTATGMGNKVLSGADLSGAELWGVDLATSDLRGAVLDDIAPCNPQSPSQCVGLAGALLGGGSCAPGGGGSGVRMRNVDFSTLPSSADLTGGAAFCLQNVDMQGAGFGGMNLDDGDFGGADLRGVDFGSASLVNGVFTSADLSSATLTGSTLTGASFVGASLRAAKLRGIDFNAIAGFSFQDLAGAPFPDLFQADISQADVSNMDLSGIDLSFGTLGDSNMAGADLRGASLSRADGSCIEAPPTGCLKLAGADLGGADLSEATLPSVDLTGVSLGNASLTSADLTNAILTGIEACMSGGVVTACASFADAILLGVQAVGVDFSAFPIDLAGRLLSDSSNPADFTDAGFAGLNMTGATLRTADMTRADLSGSLLTDIDFSGAQFSAGSSGGAGACVPATTPTDLRGADLSGAQLETALSFYASCILVDAGTTYTEGEGGTTFPPGFTVKDSMTLIPEPAGAALQLAALFTLLHLRRRAVRPTRRGAQS